MTKHRLPALAIASALMLSAVTPAFAGVVTGNGKLTPGGDNSASACSFSGLNDHPDGAPGDFPGKIQNFAHFLFFFETLLGINLTPQSPELPFTPGENCRGHVEFGG
jgi:hypothetical protein